MKLIELKNWINNLPDTFNDYKVVNGEVGKLDEKYHYRVDNPLTTLMVDEETKEVVLMNDSDADIEIPEDNEVDEIVEALRSDEFKEKFRKQIEDDTWGQNKPMYYMDEDGWLVEHHKDDTIKKIKKI